MIILEHDNQPTRQDLAQIETVLIDKARGKPLDAESMQLLGLLTDSQLQTAEHLALHVVQLQTQAGTSADRETANTELAKLEKSVPVRLGVIQEQIKKLEQEASQLRAQLAAASSLVSDQTAAIEKLQDYTPVHLRGALAQLHRERSRSDHARRSVLILIQRLDLVEKLVGGRSDSEPVTLIVFCREAGLPENIFSQAFDGYIDPNSGKRVGEQYWTITTDAWGRVNAIFAAYRAKIQAELDTHLKNIDRVNGQLLPIKNHYVPE